MVVEEEPKVEVQPAGITPKARISNVIRVSDLTDFAGKKSFMKSQHILTCQWFNLCSGLLLLLFTCGATMVRLGAPSMYAEVSSPAIKLMDASAWKADSTMSFMQIDSVRFVVVPCRCPSAPAPPSPCTPEPALAPLHHAPRECRTPPSIFVIVSR